MKIFLLTGIIFGAALSCLAQGLRNSDILKDSKKGWQILFDGKTLNGWHSYGEKTPGPNWKARDGVLYRDSTRGTDGKESHGSDLVTNKEYGNFDLKFEWKIPHNGNSGIVFLLKEDQAKYPNTYNTGYEMQLFDMESTTHIQNRKHDAGDLYDLISAKKGAIKPRQEWNKSEIICDNGKLAFFLNGTEVITTTLWNDQWKKMIAASKFAAMENFGTFKTGKIALQDHGAGVYFRNILIKEL